MVTPTLDPRNEQKPSLIFYGSSHSKRMVRWAKLSTELKQKYTIVDFSKPGCRIGTSLIPKFRKLKQNDVVIINIFGNSVFKKSGVVLEKKGIQKTFHLTSFCPTDPKVLESEFHLLLEATRGAVCKIFMLTNIIRHVHCCSLHQHKRIVPHQKLVNKKIQEFFHLQGNITVLDHWNFLGISKRTLRNNYKYSLLLPDTVHFKDELYRVMLSNIIDHLGSYLSIS